VLKKALTAVAILLLMTTPGLAEETEESPAWQGSLGLSLVATSGNSDTKTLGLDFSLGKTPDPWGLKLDASFIHSEQEGETTAERYSLHLRGERSLGGRWQLFTGVSGLQDKLAGYDMRVVFEGGATFHALRQPRHELSLDSGLTWTKEDLTLGGSDDYLGGLLGLAYKWQISDSAAFSERLIWYPNFDESGDWRATSETALQAAVSSRLALKLGYQLRYENQPVEGFDDTDATTRVSLVVTF
jgi:putative salt-induced outer membrane protein